MRNLLIISLLSKVSLNARDPGSYNDISQPQRVCFPFDVVLYTGQQSELGLCLTEDPEAEIMHGVMMSYPRCLVCEGGDAYG